MTTIQIVQRLLDLKQITAEEAVILLTKEKEYIYASSPYYWWNGYNTWTPGGTIGLSNTGTTTGYWTSTNGREGL